MADEKEKEDVEKEQIRKDLTSVRIWVSSKNLKQLEKVCGAMVKEAKTRKLEVKGPHRLPRKRFTITTRKSPCGEGTNTYERWELRVFKRRIDVICTTDDMKEVTRIGMNPAVNIDVTVEEI